MKGFLKHSGIWLMALTFFFADDGRAQPLNAIAPVASTPPHREDRILVLPRNSEAITPLHAQLGAAVLARYPGLGELQCVRVPPGESVSTLIAKYQASGLVEYAEPDYWRTLDLTPNDPQYANGTAWALHNFGQNGGVVDADIDAAEGWDVLTSASNIIVAVIDTGIRRTHEDLAANIWTNAAGGYGWNALATNNLPADDEGHGSLVAGVLGAVGNNGKGSAGVAWQVQIMACKSFDAARNGSDSDIIAGIEFARTNAARIINMSLSGAGFSTSLSNALFAARAAGIIVVTSAGNDAANIDTAPRYPACYELDNIISVAATTRTDELWNLSNYGATNVDLAAPGHQITSTFTFSDNLYIGPVSGTSFAAPYVAGTCALLMTKYPTESHQQLIARVLNGVDPLPALTGKCVTGGRLNLRKALSPPVQLAVLSVAGTLPLQLRVNAGPNRNCVVEASTNLTSWLPVHTNTTSGAGWFDFTAPAEPSAAHQFYRAVSAL